MSTKADPTGFVIGWAYGCEDYGDDHLIEGLYELHQEYLKVVPAYPASLLADYLFFLGYSGLVLAAAIEKTSIGQDCLFIWGFHDGDLLLLSHATPGRTTRRIVFPEG